MTLALDPDYPNARLNLGNSYAMTGNYEKALQAYNDVLTQLPMSSEVYLNMGRVYELLHQIPDARRSFTKALELNPSLHEARTYLDRLKH